MKVIALIPARMGSSRFPGKPLKKIVNKEMILHVMDNATEATCIDEVYVATCDIEIFNLVTTFGGKAIMTSNKHERASDRCAEALLKIDPNKEVDIVVMIQGDEPMVNSKMLEQAIKPMIDDQSINVTNLLGKLEDNDYHDQNCIKVVTDLNSDALYFSRSAIPSNGLDCYSSVGRQICVIPFRRDFLIKYTNMKPTPLEVAESVDMLRILEHGYKVRLINTKYKTYPVDTLEDLHRVESLMNQVK